MRVVQGYILKFVCKLRSTQYYKTLSTFDGAFFLQRRWWIDCSFIRKKFPGDIANEICNFSIPFSEVGQSYIKRFTRREKNKLMSLMLTLDEVAILTRIPEKILRKAGSMGDLKIISLGGRDFVSRQETERVLETTLDEETIVRLSELKMGS